MSVRSIAYKSFLFICLCAVLTASSRLRAEGPDDDLIDRIVEAFNSIPSEIVAPLKREQVKIRHGQGRVDVNVDVKFSYFVQTLVPGDPQSSTLLIPMATSRYTPTYYQTDEWWDEHKDEIEAARREGRPAPRQDMEEVKQWLRQQKLSTNPFVIEIPGNGSVARRTRLQDFLRKHLISEYASDGVLTLYRGGEKAGEINSWLQGQKPRGARYWTPTANYAWRYARKASAFLEELVDGRAPLFVFKIPVTEFMSMTQGNWPQLTLGTELTKNAHSAFDRTGIFKDHLYDMDYPGEGRLGVEIELRSNRSGAEQMTRYFKGAIGIEELANDRIGVLRRAEARLKSIYPARAESLGSLIQARVDRTLAEARLLIALREKMPREHVSALLGQLPSGRSEIAYIDSVDLTSFARGKMKDLPSDAGSPLKLSEIDRRFGLSRSKKIMTCEDLFK